MKHSSTKLFTGIGLSSFITSLVLVGITNAQWSVWPFGASGEASSNSSEATVTLPPPRGNAEQSGGTEEQIITTVEAAQDAVVSVIITKDLPRMEQGTRRVPYGNRGYIEVPQMLQNGTEQREVGGGTAFFVTADGILMTNKHVVSDTSADYSVLLNDGRTLKATIVGRDPVSDIALLKVEGSGFTPLVIAPDDDLHLGQTAIAIGNALGEFRNTVSVGVVSGLQRSIIAGGLLSGGTEQLDQIIQTDAAINTGNSGGPLLNSRGEVIGMNTAVSSTGNGIGFALPAKELRRVYESYRRNGRIVTAFLGLRYAQITADLQTRESLPFNYGVLAVAGDDGEPAVTSGSPAEKAGLREGDIILEVDGQRLTPDQPFARIIQSKSPGDRITLRLWREGKESDLTVTLGEWK